MTKSDENKIIYWINEILQEKLVVYIILASTFFKKMLLHKNVIYFK